MSLRGRDGSLPRGSATGHGESAATEIKLPHTMSPFRRLAPPRRRQPVLCRGVEHSPLDIFPQTLLPRIIPPTDVLIHVLGNSVHRGKCPMPAEMGGGVRRGTVLGEDVRGEMYAAPLRGPRRRISDSEEDGLMQSRTKRQKPIWQFTEEI